MSKKVVSKGALKSLAVAVATAASVATVQQASADGLMFPYIAASTAAGGVVTTILSVTYSNKTPAASGASFLHYQTWYKPVTGNDAVDQTSACVDYNVSHNTSHNDIVTYDIGGKFGLGSDAQGVLFNDGNAFTPGKKANYGFIAFDELKTLTAPNPSRAFQVITDDQDAYDGTLYGEAMLLDLAHGAAWGYRGYNSADPGGNLIPPDFSNVREVQGEVLMEGELAPVELYPTKPASMGGGEWTQKFLVTPIDRGTVLGQLQGNLNVRLQLRNSRDVYSGANGPQVIDNPTIQGGNAIGSGNTFFDRDENPYSGGTIVPVTCVASVDANQLLSGLAITGMVNGGWAYANVLPGSVGTQPAPATNQAVVMKLIFNNGDTINGEVGLTGTVNSELWLRDGSCTGYNTLGASTNPPGCSATAPVLTNNRTGIDRF